MHHERTIHLIALAHRGLVPHAVAGARGIPEHVVRRLCRGGGLEPVHRGVSHLVGTHRRSSRPSSGPSSQPGPTWLSHTEARRASAASPSTPTPT